MKFGETFWLLYDNYVTSQLICLSVTSFYNMRQQCGRNIKDVIFYN